MPWLFILVAVLSLLISLSVKGGGSDQRISFPEEYRENHTNYLSLDRVQHPDQVARLFANDIAMQGPGDDGKLPYGSVLVAEMYNAKLDGDEHVVTSSLGRRVRDDLLFVGVMRREDGWGAQYPESIRNGNWEFAAFNPDGSPAPKDVNACMACHAPLSNTNFLFSYEHIGK